MPIIDPYWATNKREHDRCQTLLARVCPSPNDATPEQLDALTKVSTAMLLLKGAALQRDGNRSGYNSTLCAALKLQSSDPIDYVAVLLREAPTLFPRIGNLSRELSKTFGPEVLPRLLN